MANGYGYDPSWGSLFTSNAFRGTNPLFSTDAFGASPLFTTNSGVMDIPGAAEIQSLIGVGREFQYEIDPAVQAAIASGNAPPSSVSSTTPIPMGTQATPVAPGAIGDTGSALDKWDPQYVTAETQTGVPANIIKAFGLIETGGQDLTGQTTQLRGDTLALNTGIFKSTADSYGLDFNRIVTDPAYAIYAKGVVISNLANSDASAWGGPQGQTLYDYGGWEGVARVYHGGAEGLAGTFVDEQGRSSTTYAQQFMQHVATLGGAPATATTTGLDPTLPVIEAPTALPGSAVTGIDPATGLSISTPQEVTQWNAYIQQASEYYGVPADRIAAHIAANSGGVWTDPTTDISAQQPDTYGGAAYGLMKITPEAAGDYCTTEWCGWGTGAAETQATGVNHNIYTPDGNIMMGAAILRNSYETAKAIYPNATEDQLWDLASSIYETGNLAWDDGGDGQAAAQTQALINSLTAPPVEATLAPQATAGVTQPFPETTLVNPGTTPPPLVTSDPTGQSIVDLANQYVNVPYVWGGNPQQGQNPYQTGWDCSGFVSFIADSLGYSVRDTPNGIPEGSGAQGDWADATGRMKPVNQAQPGDVIFFDTRDSGGSNGGVTGRYTHVGIYLGDGMMINAMQECGPGLTAGVDCGTGVVALNSPYWSSHAIGAASMIPAA